MVIRFPRTSRRGSRRVHGKKIIGAQVLAFPVRSAHKGRPHTRGDTPPLLPFTDSPMTFADGVSHFGDGAPKLKNLSDGHLAPHNARDKLSRQVRTSLPATGGGAAGTIRPMSSRAITPTWFKKEFCNRLRAARVTARKDQAEFARELGLLPNTYGKYENRTLLPHYLVPRACLILGIEPAALYPSDRLTHRKAG